jgi:hypothetical protein
VEGDHYLTTTTPSQQRVVEAIVEDAQHDLLRRAHPPMVVTDEDAASLARDYPELIGALGLDDAVLAERLPRKRKPNRHRLKPSMNRRSSGLTYIEGVRTIGPSVGGRRDVRFGWSAPTLLMSGADRGR